VGATVGVVPEGALPVDAGGSTQPVRIAKSSIAVAKIQKVFFMIISPFYRDSADTHRFTGQGPFAYQNYILTAR
jgi:hypothetical protein